MKVFSVTIPCVIDGEKAIAYTDIYEDDAKNIEEVRGMLKDWEHYDIKNDKRLFVDGQDYWVEDWKNRKDELTIDFDNAKIEEKEEDIDE